jgi:hypothetical protein
MYEVFTWNFLKKGPTIRYMPLPFCICNALCVEYIRMHAIHTYAMRAIHTYAMRAIHTYAAHYACNTHATQYTCNTIYAYYIQHTSNTSNVCVLAYNTLALYAYLHTIPTIRDSSYVSSVTLPHTLLDTLLHT